MTQTQLDEAMKPGQFGSHGSVGEITSSVCESSMPSSSLLVKENPFSSAANPINSLLAGEKIQFGEHAKNLESLLKVAFVIF